MGTIFYKVVLTIQQGKQQQRFVIEATFKLLEYHGFCEEGTAHCATTGSR